MKVSNYLKTKYQGYLFGPEITNYSYNNVKGFFTINKHWARNEYDLSTSNFKKVIQE